MTNTNVTATPLKTVPNIDFNLMEQVCGSTIFPELYQPGEVKLSRRVNRHPDCQQSNPDYIPEEMLLRRLLGWWYGFRGKALGLSGETGTGKTELALFIADKLNEPLYIIKVHPALMPEDLEGSKELVCTSGGIISKPSLGLAAKAYRNGGLLLLDEVDKSNSALGCSIHGLVENKPWPIEQFGIVLNAHPYYRCMGTANTMGEGGHERYHTSTRMDQALRSRFGWLTTHFPTKVREMAILDKKFPMFPQAMKRNMVELANAYRDALLGPAQQNGTRDGNIDNPINAVFSTRTLVEWAKGTMAFGKKALWSESLDFAFQGSIDPEHVDSCDDIRQRILGTTIDKAVEDVVKEYSPVKK
jgi:cobaltochelatase CobS